MTEVTDVTVVTVVTDVSVVKIMPEVSYIESALGKSSAPGVC